MNTKNYQVRIRKSLENTEIHQSAIEIFGQCIATEIRALHVKFSSMNEAFEKISSIKEFEDYEIISVILIDEDNREQLGEDFDWEEQE